MTSKLIVNSIRHTGASADAITMDASGNVTFPANATCSGTATGFGGGKLLQVVQTRVVTTSSTANSSFSDTSLVRTITPASASNKILCLIDMQVGGSHPASVVFKLVRFDNNGTGTNIAYSSVSSNNPGFYQSYVNYTGAGIGYYGLFNVGVNTLDTAVNAAEHSYRVQWRVVQGTAYLNRTGYGTTGTDYSGTGCSTITLMEVAAQTGQFIKITVE